MNPFIPRSIFLFLPFTLGVPLSLHAPPPPLPSLASHSTLSLSPKPLFCSLCEKGNRSNHSKATICVWHWGAKPSSQAAANGSLWIQQNRSAARAERGAGLRGPNAVGTTVLQPGPNFTLMNLDPARLLQKAAVAIQYPPRWSEATPMAAAHARKRRAMWKRREGGKRERMGWGGGGQWLFLSLAPVCSAQPFIPAHAQTRGRAYEQTQACTCLRLVRQQGTVCRNCRAHEQTHTSKRCHTSCNGA